jgi:outer membrane receptor protein involved in Fe transport
VSDLRVNYDLNRFLGGQAHLLLSVNNLFDARYANNGWAYRYRSDFYDARPDDPYTRYEGGGVYHQAGFFPQAGRHYMATLQLVF